MEYNGNPESVGYKIKYSRSDGHGKTLSHVVQDRVEREYTIEDLEEWTEYRVQVQAFNAIGSGPWSQAVMGRTRESGYMRDRSGEQAHPESGGTLGLPWAFKRQDPRARLKPFTSYKFRVKATNDIGDSEFSEESESLTTLQAAPDEAPTILSVTPHTTTSVLIRWQ
ncbi:protein sidekick-2 isoform 1, partial [Cricetulus griseus]